MSTEKDLAYWASLPVGNVQEYNDRDISHSRDYVVEAPVRCVCHYHGNAVVRLRQARNLSLEVNISKSKLTSELDTNLNEAEREESIVRVGIHAHKYRGHKTIGGYANPMVQYIKVGPNGKEILL